MSETGASGEAVAERIIRLGRALQGRVDLSMAEIIDASRAAEVIDLGSRQQLRLALRATMIKDPQHYPTFDATFDRLFPVHLGRDPATDLNHAAERGAELVASDADLRPQATELVDQHAGLDGDRRGEGHHMRRVYRAADLARLMSEARKLDPEADTERLRARIEELKRMIAADVRAHLGELEGGEPVGPYEDIEFLNASRAELDDLRAAIRPLARKLAARLARRRRALHQGKVNIRRTTRRSLATGGVPMDVATDRPRAHRPELFVLCDISGSVADFSLFTLSLVAAFSAEIGRTRSFVFVDGIDEITGLLASTDHGIEPWQILRNTNVIADDGHSDYGAVLRQFWNEVADHELRRSSTVIITGDGRANYRDNGSDMLEKLARRGQLLYWLNPEPEAEWDTHDSEMATYGPFCTQVFEVRNVRQLISCVEAIF